MMTRTMKIINGTPTPRVGTISGHAGHWQVMEWYSIDQTQPGGKPEYSRRQGFGQSCSDRQQVGETVRRALVDCACVADTTGEFADLAR